MPIGVDVARLHAAYRQVRDELLAERTPDGHWIGQLSSSALSTATAISALAVVRSRGYENQSRSIDDLIQRGVTWLAKQQNSDGGFGDTDLSHSNIATTYLVVAALTLAKSAVGNALRGIPGADEASLNDLLARAYAYIDSKGRLQGLRERYGIDKTFVVPIMTNLALAGLVDWQEIDPLPFELACVPQSWYRFVGMPVVSYAIPALVAIGQARFFHAPPRNPITRLVRQLSISRSLKVLRRMQPDSGGYLEATPLTSFVVMSLASCRIQNSEFRIQNSGDNGHLAHQVISEGVKFLVTSARPDGSWPIDTNLATWNTTLAINALSGAGEDVSELLGPQCLDWLLSCQQTKPHPFTGATPGGFGWSDLSGAVPDADDTPGAVLALASWQTSIDEHDPDYDRIHKAITSAAQWLLQLRNRDGGWPTFCRGWGKLPFDRSGADLTAHAMRVGPKITAVGDSSEWLRYIKQNQHPDGTWSPLWFGNQDHPTEDNPAYGTAKVLMAYRDLGLLDSPEAQRGIAWLIANQNHDGGWGSGVWERAIPNLKSQTSNFKSSVEETALAVEALLAACSNSNTRNATEGVPYSASLNSEPRTLNPLAAVEKGLNWLMERVENNQHRQPAPIGFYFAKLWYYERLYPLIFTVAALGRARRQFAPPADNFSADHSPASADRAS